VLLLDFPVTVNTPGIYSSTLEFYNSGNPFGQKILSSFSFDNFSIEDLNPNVFDVLNYTISLQYKTDYNKQFIPYLYVFYRSGTVSLSTDIVAGSNSNGLLSFSFLPNFKAQSNLNMDVYLVFSASNNLMKTFSYFYSETYSVNFKEASGIIVDSYPVASISVDGVNTNLSTRAFIPLSYGNHTITLIADGYNTYTTNLDFTSLIIFCSFNAVIEYCTSSKFKWFDFGSQFGRSANQFAD